MGDPQFKLVWCNNHFTNQAYITKILTYYSRLLDKYKDPPEFMMTSIFGNLFANIINATLVSLIDLKASIHDAACLVNYPVVFFISHDSPS